MRSKSSFRGAFLLATTLVFCSFSDGYASEGDNARVPHLYILGQMGLNTIPSARMGKAGQIVTGVSRTAPYTHIFAGLQISDNFYLGLRQSAESNSFNSNALHLYPGLDAKLKLYGESRYIPQISVGLQSALGHKRMAAEYLALSKRYENFDFTFGFGWGRMASRMSLPNPILLKSYDGSSRRTLDGENPNSPRDWFSGDMGLFGGVEYNTPISGLSLIADWNSDGWKAERAVDPTFKKPSPFSLGISYKPREWLDTGIAYSPNQSVMFRVAFTPQSTSWPLSESTAHTSIPLRANRPDPSPYNDDDDDENNEYNEDDFGNALNTEGRLGLTNIFITPRKAEATLTLNDYRATPLQIGEAARYISNQAGKTPEQIIFHLRHKGLQGTDIHLNRPDLERAMLKHTGSSEEIWHSTFFEDNHITKNISQTLSEMGIASPRLSFKFDILNDISLSEEDSGLLYRSGLRLTLQKFFAKYFVSYQSLRINIADNLQKMNAYRTASLNPIRSDINAFTQHGLIIEHEYVGGFFTLKNDLHSAIHFGYLDEMFMGLSGEILYRPFGKNWAIGADASLVNKRDPYTLSALAPASEKTFSAFLNGYYEIPATNATFKTSIGRFLGNDIGAEIALENQFDNGVKMKAFAAASNRYDPDMYGGKTNIYTGFELSLPLGSPKFIPDGSRLITTAKPFGRDTAQRLNIPTNLYDMTEPLSYRHIAHHWADVMPNRK